MSHIVFTSAEMAAIAAAERIIFTPATIAEIQSRMADEIQHDAHSCRPLPSEICSRSSVAPSSDTICTWQQFPSSSANGVEVRPSI